MEIVTQCKRGGKNGSFQELQFMGSGIAFQTIYKLRVLLQSVVLLIAFTCCILLENVPVAKTEICFLSLKYIM